MHEHTVENWTSKVTDKLQEHVFFFRCQLVETGSFAAVLDVVGGESSLDVGHEPVFGDLEKYRGGLFAEQLGEEALLFNCGIDLFGTTDTGSLGETTISVG